MVSTDSKLSAKHEAFAQRIANGEAASRAYGAVYGVKGATAEVNGCKLLRNTKVAARIRALQDENALLSQLSRNEALAYLADIVRTPCGLVTADSKLAEECVERTTRDGLMRVVKMPSKLGAVQVLARMCGWHEPEKQDLRVSSHPAIEEALDRMFAKKAG